VYISVRPHDYFERNGNDLYCLVPISLTQATLGSEIMVSTLEDGHRVKMKIPPGTQTGRVFRLKNEGVPYLHNPERRGDLFVKVTVQVPTRLSAKARSLLEQLAEHTGEEENPTPIRWLEMRINSSMITLMYSPRSGTCMPASFSTDRT